MFQIYLSALDHQQLSQLTLGTDNYDLSAVSPDGTRIIGKARKQYANLWVWDLTMHREMELTSELALHVFPAASPSDQALVFQSARDEVQFNDELFLKSLGSKSQVTRLTTGHHAKWSPDGSQVLFTRNAGLWVINPHTGSELQLLNEGVYEEGLAVTPYNVTASGYSWARDSRKLTYCTRKPVPNVWEIQSDGTGVKQVSNNTDANTDVFDPVWSLDDQYLAFGSKTGSTPSKPASWSLWIRQAGVLSILKDFPTVIRVAGWSAPGNEIIVLQWQTETSRPQPIKLLAISLSNGSMRQIAQLPAAYLGGATLSSDSQLLACVTRRNDKDAIELVRVNNGQILTITASAATDVFYSGLSWAQGGKSLIYSKQTSYLVAPMVERIQ
jgi:dipeptidyl aminopeptidase/acylaminoacyl peptidase